MTKAQDSGRTVTMGSRPDQAWRVSRDLVDMTRPPRPVRALSIRAELQDIVVDAHKAALLIVDMQNDFCSEGGWLHSRGIDVSPNRKPIGPIRNLAAAFRREGLPVIWVNWGVRKDLLNIHPSLRHAHSPRGDEPGLAEPVPGTRSEVIARGSWGAEVVDEINPGDGDIQIVKHRFSAFWDTETDSVLRNLGVKTLLIGGVNMDQCVMTTLEDASFLGYDTVLIQDATATTSPDFCIQSVLYNVKLLFGFVAQSEAVLAALDRAEN